jgi:type III restriction enzyme
MDWQAGNERKRAPAVRGVPFAPIPRLMAMMQGELELVERETFLDLAGWNLADVPARLEPAEFTFDDTAKLYRFELDGEALVYTVETSAPELALDYAAGWTPSALSRWLDREIEHGDTVQPVFLEWLRLAIADLMERRGLALPMLVRGRYALRRAIEAKVRAARTASAAAGTGLLFTMPGAVVVLPAHAFSFDPNVNPAASVYGGAWKPAKHYYGTMGDLNGEEVECAQVIDALPNVRHWVRNGDRDRKYAFWLPTSTDAFYPDFVAELDDGRLLVIEYKGADRIGNPDTLEKDNIGKRWADASAGRCLFVTVCKAKDRPPLRAQVLAALA